MKSSKKEKPSISEKLALWILTQKLKKMNKEKILGIVRHILTIVGGSFVTDGTLTENNLNLGVGAILTLAGIIWSIFAPEKK